MIPILTVTLNPALDIETFVDRVSAGPKLRCSEPRRDPGGGGINVSRAIANLGGASTAFVALAGQTGQLLASLLAAEGIGHVGFPIFGETRESLSVTDRSTGAQYRFVMPGPAWTEGDRERVLAAIARTGHAGGLVVLSGSTAPGLPDDFAHRLAAVVGGNRVVADTSGGPLAAIIRRPAGLHLLRMNGDEAESAAGRPLAEPDEAAAYASGLVAGGVARIVVIAMGDRGSVLVTADSRLASIAPKVPVKSKVGAGDSFVGALVLALARGESHAEALRQGTAAAAAAVMTEGTRLCQPDDVANLATICQVRPV
jgi:6-phosphofructokinase 2